MRQLFALLLAIIAILFARTAGAAEAELLPKEEPKPVIAAPADPNAAPSDVPTVDLYTIGPHNDFPSRLGHAILCVREAGHDDVEHGHCYDYGVPESQDMFEVGYTAMRGLPNFRPIAIGEPTMLHFFKEQQGRQVEKQRLPLSAAETKKLITSVDKEIADEVVYAYHPYWANCTTKIRDHIDEATGGKLHGVPSTLPQTTLREYLEEGHSGHIGILTAMAIFFGEGNDKVPTAWEAMLFPPILRDAVTERFGAKPEQISERMAVILPTSRALGKITLFAMSLMLFLVVRLCARKNRVRLALGIVGGAFGSIALVLATFALIVKWTEISHNWALLLFFPTDFALAWMAKSKPKLLPLYLKGRIGLAVIMAVLEIANVIHQPLLPLAALVVMPFIAILGVLKERENIAESAPVDAKAA